MRSVSVSPVRSGCGSSFVSANAACALSDDGRRVLLLEKAGEHDITGLRIWMNLITREIEGASGISSDSIWQCADRLFYASITEDDDLDVAAEMFAAKTGADFVITDGSTLTSPDLALLCCEPDSGCATRLYDRVLGEHEFLVLNKTYPFSKVREDLCFYFAETFRGHTAPVRIPYDDFVQSSALGCVPVVRSAPFSAAATEIRQLAAWIQLYTGGSGHEE